MRNQRSNELPIFCLGFAPRVATLKNGDNVGSFPTELIEGGNCHDSNDCESRPVYIDEHPHLTHADVQ